MFFQRKLLDGEGKKKVEAAIEAAEKLTSGEIRVAIKDNCRCDPMEEARKTFFRLGMEKTDRKNGVLLFIAVKQKKFAIIGDEGIDSLMGQEGWDAVRDLLADRFARSLFAEGIAEAVAKVGEVLAAHFPPVEGDVDELSNSVEDL